MQTASVEYAINESREMINRGEAPHRILLHLVRAAEKLAGKRSVSSILLIDKEGLLRNGCSPGLPSDYLTAIDGLKPNRNVGTCAVTAATGEITFTPDFTADNKWAELRHLPLALGFAGAWSYPIKNPDGKVLGTFGTYYTEQRKPTKEELDGIRALAGMAAEVLVLA